MFKPILIIADIVHQQEPIENVGFFCFGPFVVHVFHPVGHGGFGEFGDDCSQLYKIEFGPNQ